MKIFKCIFYWMTLVEEVKPTSASAIVIQATSAPSTSSSIVVASKPTKDTVSVSSAPSNHENERKGKAVSLDNQGSGPASLIEASEYEPQVFATSFSSSSSSDFDETTALESHVIASAVLPSSSSKNLPKQVKKFPPPFIQVSFFSLLSPSILHANSLLHFFIFQFSLSKLTTDDNYLKIT